jgi:hypothetical protein
LCVARQWPDAPGGINRLLHPCDEGCCTVGLLLVWQLSCTLALLRLLLPRLRLLLLLLQQRLRLARN